MQPRRSPSGPARALGARRGRRSRARVLAASAGATLVALLVTACGPQPEPRAVEGTSVDVAWSGELTSTNAASTPGATAANLDVAAMTRGQFTTVDDTGELLEDPSFGTATVVNDAPFRVRYDIADGVRWSDGVPVDAADLMLAWAASSNALSSEELDLAALRGADGRLDLPDDAVWFDVADPGGMTHATAASRDDWARAIDVEFDQEVPDWQSALDVAVPAHVLGQRVLGVSDAMQAKQAVLDVLDRADPLALRELAIAWVDEFAVDPLAPDADVLLSSGPYRVESLQDGRVGLTANRDYVGDRGASVERITLRPVSSDRAALGALAAGELDVATAQPVEEDRTVVRDLERDGATLINRPYGSRWELVLRTDRAPLQTVEARTSFLRAVDHRSASELYLAATQQEGVATDSILFRSETRVYGYALEDSGFEAAYGQRDTEAAAAQREEAGIDAGTAVCVRYDTAQPFAAAMVEAMQAQVAEAGWAVRDCGVDDLAEGLQGDDWHATLRLVTVPQTVEQIDERWRGGGITAAESADRDALLDEALTTADRDAVESSLLELETLLVADALVLPLVEPTRLTISAEGVSGVSPHVGDAPLTWNAWSWGVEEDAGP